MNFNKLIIAISILQTGPVFGQTAQVENSLKNVDYIFEKFINDNRSGSDSNILICADFNKLVADNKIDKQQNAVHILKKSIAELYSYTNLESQDYKLILTPPAQKKLFDSLMDNIEKLMSLSTYNIYIFAVAGYYHDNVERDHLKAENYYKKAFESGTPFPSLLLWRSYNLFRSNGDIKTINSDSAKIWLAKCVQEKPDYPSAYVCLGHWAGLEDNYPKAYSLFSQCLKLDPLSKDGNNALGFWYNRRKMYDSAIVYYENIIQRYPQFIRAMINLSGSYKAKNSQFYYDKAVAIYKKCISVDSLDASYYNNIAELYSDKLKQYDSALYYYREEVRLDPSQVYKLGNFYYDYKRDYKKAVKYYNDYSQINPSALLYNVIGNCYSNMVADSISRAIIAYKKAIELDTTFLNCYDQLGFLYNSIFKYDSSIYYYTKLIGINMSPDKKKSYISDMGFPYRNYANLKMSDNYFAAYSILKEGARRGNRGCKFMSFAMQNEFGFDDSEIDFKQAKTYYVEAARLWPFNKLGIDGILRLYKKNNIPLGDSTDYKMWKKMDTAVLNSRYWTITTYLDTLKKQSNIRLLKSYPPGVHPLEWERKRLQEDFGLTIKEEEYEKVAKLYREAKDEGQSLTDYSVNSSDKKIAAAIDKLNKTFAESKDEETMTTIKGKWEERVKLKPDDDDVKLNASEFYRVSAIEYFDAGNFDMALEMAERGREIYSSNRLLIRVQCEILVVSGKLTDAFAIYDKYRQQKYFTDEERTYREMFLIDIPEIKKKYSSRASDIEKAELYLYSAKEKLKKNLITYTDVLSSKDPQLLFDAAMYFADSGTKDSLMKSFACYEKLLSFKDSAIFNNFYIEAIARYRRLPQSEKYNPSIKNIDALFASSSFYELEKILLKWRMQTIKDHAYNEAFYTEINKLASTSSYWEIMYVAFKYKATARNEKIPDTASLIFAARKAIDIYIYVKEKMPATQKDYADIIKLIAKRCGEFSYSILLLKDYGYALKASVLANSADPDEPYAKTNLPIAYVLTGEYEKGKALYLAYKDDKFIDGRSFKEVFLEDIDDLKNKGIPVGRLEEIKILLNQN